jgi:Tfp pilus assembly protein PilX
MDVLLRTRASERERGSIAIVMMVMLVCTGLVVGVLQVTYTGLRVSRRSGDSANALQVADAGINDAARRIPTAQTSTFDDTVSLGSAGSYTFTATFEVGTNVWHLDSTGTDPTGVKRRVKADARSDSLFSAGLLTNALLALRAGSTVDSYTNGANTCTGHGIIGTNDSTNLSFQGSAGQNCSGNYAADGCIAYGDGTQPLPPIGTAECPPAPKTVKTSPKFPMTPIPAAAYSDLTLNTSPTTCDTTHPIAGGYRYYQSSVTMRDGCWISPLGTRAVIFTPGNVTVGDTNGLGGDVNRPPANRADLCGSVSTSSTARDYCPGWPANLQIFMVGGGGAMAFNNHGKFWGVIYGPQSAVLNAGSGSPHVDIWGSIIANSSSSNAQFSMHYDESLSDLATNGLYDIFNWREEPV